MPRFSSLPNAWVMTTHADNQRSDHLKMTTQQFDNDLDAFRRQDREAEAIQHAVSLAPCAAAAFGELLEFADRGFCGQAAVVANFLTSVRDDADFNSKELSLLSMDLGTRILCCIDFQRYEWLDIRDLVPDGFERLCAVVTKWGGAMSSGIAPSVTRPC